MFSTFIICSSSALLAGQQTNASLDSTDVYHQYQYQSQIFLARASFIIKNAIGGAT